MYSGVVVILENEKRRRENANTSDVQKWYCIEGAKSDAIGDMVAITKEVEFSDLKATSEIQLPLKFLQPRYDPCQAPSTPTKILCRHQYDSCDRCLYTLFEINPDVMV